MGFIGAPSRGLLQARYREREPGAEPELIDFIAQAGPAGSGRAPAL